MQPGKLTVEFDHDHDVLSISVGPKRPGRDEEEESGLVWRFDWITGALLGVTMVDFERYWRRRILRLSEIIAEKLEVSRSEAEEILKNVA